MPRTCIGRVHPRHYYLHKSPHAWSEIEDIICRELGIEAPAMESDHGADCTPAGAPEGVTNEADNAAVAVKSRASDGASSETDVSPRTTGHSQRGSLDQRCAAHKDRAKRRTALCIDDDWDLADALAIRASALGLQVRTVHDGLATMHALQTQAPDLLILDVNMPAGDGMSVCEAMTSDPELSGIPVLVLTGRSDDATLRRCHEMGARHVPKSHDVWQRIEALLRELVDLERRPQPRP